MDPLIVDAVYSLAFHTADKDGNGSIDEEEMTSLLALLGVKAEDKEATALWHQRMSEARVPEEPMKEEPKEEGEHKEVEEQGTNLNAFLRCITRMKDAGEYDPSAWNAHLAIAAHEAFLAADTDNSGSIDVDELVAVGERLELNLSREDAEKLCKEADLDGNGEMEWDEFVTACMKQQKLGQGELTGLFTQRNLSQLGSFASDEEPSKEEVAATLKELNGIEKLGVRILSSRAKAKQKLHEAKRKEWEAEEEALSAKDVELQEVGERRDTEYVELHQRVMGDSRRHAMASKMKWYIFRAALVGLVMGTIAGLIEIWAGTKWDADGGFSSKSAITFQIVATVDALVFSVSELLIMYYDGMRVSLSLGIIGGFRLWPLDRERAFLLGALSRAALDLGFPAKDKRLKMNAAASSTFLRTVIRKLAWKSRAKTSQFIAKIGVKRLAARLLARIAQPFVAVPIICLWNALVARRVGRRARVIALGPGAALAAVNELFKDQRLTTAGRAAALQVVTSFMIRDGQMHPNRVILLQRLQTCFIPPADTVLDDEEMLFESLTKCTKEDAEVVVALLMLGAALNGTATRTESRFARECALVLEQHCCKEVGIRTNRKYIQANMKIQMNHLAHGEHLDIDAMCNTFFAPLKEGEVEKEDTWWDHVVDGMRRGLRCLAC